MPAASGGYNVRVSAAKLPGLVVADRLARGPPMQQVANWLESLGMSEYRQRFAESRIDFSILPDLTDQDLEKMGVVLGDRRKMLRAIAVLNDAPPSTAPAVPAVTPALSTAPMKPMPAGPPPAAATQVAGERRYLTVMFCDLVGSTGIAAQLDAEEWRDLVGAYLDAASAAVTEMGGHVAKKLGDGILALFGYPQAHENDAERAARAALAIQRALVELNHKNAGSGKPELVARIGLETGPAVVDAAGEIYGDVANVAARVQTLAEPGVVLVTAQVQRQIAGLFVAEERGTQALKGVAEPVALFRIVRASGGGRHLAQRQLTPLVGRDEEMATLMRRWERARAGDGQLVLIVGEPGLGKSRLIEEFHSRLREVPHTWSEWSCAQLLQNTPLHPIVEWGRQRFGGADMLADRRLADLETALALVKLDPAETVPLVAPLLDIPLPKERQPALMPEELRRRQLAAMTSWALASARIQPVVLACEDLHWADPTTLDVLKSVAERAAQAPMLILATTRPEFRPPWIMRSHHATISLAPLDRQQVRDMVAELSARHALAMDVVDDVAARTGGVPLFVEEVTRLLLERGGQGGIETIPPTLQQSLMARLDRLGPAREVAQMGAVIGRGFSYALLHDVAGLEEAPLQAALEKLAEADIVLVQGLAPEADYRFKHALIQDAAYENLLKSRRQVLHRRVAEILRDRFADAAAAEPEVLAHHFTQAGLTDAAIEWWGNAGDQALRRSAFQEAIAHLGKAIEMADKLGDDSRPTTQGPGSVAKRLKLQTSYGHATAQFRGFSSDETKAAFAKAQQLLTKIDDPTERFVTYYGLWLGGLSRGDLASARSTAETFWRDAESASRMTEVAIALMLLGLTGLLQGDFGSALSHLQGAFRIYDPQRDHEAKFRFAFDAGAWSAVCLAGAYWLVGEVEEARVVLNDARRRAINSGHAVVLAIHHAWEAVFETLRGDAKAVRQAAQLCINVSREHGLTVFLSEGIGYLGWASVQLGDRKTGIAQLNECISIHAEQGNRLFIPFFQGLLAEIEAQEDDGAPAALARIDAAKALATEMGAHWCDAFLHQIRAKILLKCNPADTAAAEEAFHTAIAIAQQQHAKSFELRAALSLARLYQSTGRAADAHAVLAHTLEGFTPTPEFPEIGEALALRATLAETDEVKTAAEARRRRLKLQTTLGRAIMFSRGFGAEETKTAFAQAQELATGVAAPAELLETSYAQWASLIMHGEFGAAAAAAKSLLRGLENSSHGTKAALGRRMLGLTRLMQGDFIGSRLQLKNILEIYGLRGDRGNEIAFDFEPERTARAYLALASWALGDLAEARELISEAVKRAAELQHAPTFANCIAIKLHLEVFSGDVAQALRTGQTALDFSRDHGLGHYFPMAQVLYGWARASQGETEAGVSEMRQGLVAYTERGIRAWIPLFEGLLAEIKSQVQGVDTALMRIEQAISLSRETGEGWTNVLLHRIRGELLMKRNLENTVLAEDAFRTAISIAQQQKARSFELRAALSLAKLYQSTGRGADAQAVLAPALEGFSPTPEFGEIKEAQTLLAALPVVIQ